MTPDRTKQYKPTHIVQCRISTWNLFIFFKMLLPGYYRMAPIDLSNGQIRLSHEPLRRDLFKSEVVLLEILTSLPTTWHIFEPYLRLPTNFSLEHHG